jgi:hypothetical protein
MVLLCKPLSGLWTKGLVVFNGQNLWRQRFSAIGLVNTTLLNRAVVYPKDHAHRMFAVTFVTKCINVISGH